MTSRISDTKILLPVAITTLLGCSTTSLYQAPTTAVLANHDAPTVQGLDSCRTALSAPSTDVEQSLNPTHIGLFVWNIHKGSNPRSLNDLARMAGEKDLILIQEARLEQRPVEALDRARFWSFAPGYRTAWASTGVMTLSNAAPLSHCYLTDREPWLRSPKAISITRFNLESTDETLAVVNVHAVNFTIGVADFQKQIAKIGAALDAHRGPVILAGDFNTWRNGRLTVLRELAERLRLHELSFDIDNRVAPFGSIVDRIFVRDLYAIDASTEMVKTSDHNPMSVTLSM